jgi:AcrR family transcriptional regulator
VAWCSERAADYTQVWIRSPEGLWIRWALRFGCWVMRLRDGEVRMPVNAFGRPRDARLDRALLEATCTLLAEHGYAGTTKPAPYRRHRGRAELVIAALVDRFGDDPTHDTGNLRSF